MKTFARVVSKVLVMIAVVAVTPASLVYVHQPKVPNELLKR